MAIDQSEEALKAASAGAARQGLSGLTTEHGNVFDLLRSLRISILEGIVAMPIVTMSLPVNVFMTALVAKAFVLSKAMIGLVSALPS